MARTYTYEKFEQDGVFTLLDPLFTTILIFSVLLLITVYKFSPPAKVILFVSAFTIIIGAQLMVSIGILADELALGGSAKTTTLFILTCVIHVITLVLAFKREKNAAAH